MEGDLSTIFKLLPKLSPADLEKVLLRINFLRGGTTLKTNLVEYDWLLEGFLVELRKRGLWAGTSVSKNAIPKDYPEKANIVRKFLLRGIEAKISRPAELLVVGTVAGAAMVAHLTRIKVPITLKLMLSNVEKVPIALEESFPGYWASSLLAFGLLSKTKA